MLTLCRRWLAPVCAVLLSACGSWPAPVDSARDIRLLRADEASINAGGLTPEEIVALARLRKLQFINFERSWKGREGKVTDEGLIALGELNLPELWMVHLFDNENVTTRGLIGLCRTDALRSLGLAGCVQIDDDTLFELVRHSKLRGLSLDKCAGVTDEGLRHLSRSTSLEGLSLSGCPNISMRGALQLSSLARLRTLYIDECPQFSVEEVQRLRRTMPTVRIGHGVGIWSHAEWTDYNAVLEEAFD